MYLNNLTTNKVYDLKIQAGTRSQVGERLMHFGPFSQMQRVLLQPGMNSKSNLDEKLATLSNNKKKSFVLSQRM